MQKILHFHIPKTGGTAIRHYLIDQVGVARVSSSIVGLRMQDALLRWGDFDVMGGHFIAHQGDRLPSDRYKIVVFRDPIDRFLSEYCYSRTDNADRLLSTKLHSLELDAFLESMSPRQLEALSLQMEILYPFGTSSHSELSTSEKLTAAITALNQFQLVGIQDELEDFACMLEASFRWPSKSLGRKNVTSCRIPSTGLSSGQTRKLHTLLESEFELYHRAKDHFRKARRELLRRSVAISGASENLPPKQAQSEASIPEAPSRREFGDKRCAVAQATVSGKISGNALAMVGEELAISIKLIANEAINRLNVGIAIKDERGLLIFGTNSMLLGDVYTLAPGEYVVQFNVLNRAPLGKYSLDVALVSGETHYEGCYHWLEGASHFDVHEKATSHFEGHILMDADVEISAISPNASIIHDSYVSANHQIRSFGRVNTPLREFRSSIVPMCDAGQLYPEIDTFLPMRVQNTGEEVWRTTGQQPVTLTYRWLTESGDIVVADGLRTRIPADVSPGGSIIIPLQVRTPGEQGRYRLMVSLVQEAVAWFADKDSTSGLFITTDIQATVQP